MVEDKASIEKRRQRKEDIREGEQVVGLFVCFWVKCSRRNGKINSEDMDRGQLIKNFSLTLFIHSAQQVKNRHMSLDTLLIDRCNPFLVNKI